jgi:hypothetical protein
MSVEDRRISLRLDLTLAGEQLSGRVVDAAGTRRDFTGWMGLIAGIDALTGAGGKTAASSRQPPQDSLAPDTDRKDP